MRLTSEMIQRPPALRAPRGLGDQEGGRAGGPPPPRGPLSPTGSPRLVPPARDEDTVAVRTASQALLGGRDFSVGLFPDRCRSRTAALPGPRTPGLRAPASRKPVGPGVAGLDPPTRPHCREGPNSHGGHSVWGVLSHDTQEGDSVQAGQPFPSPVSVPWASTAEWAELAGHPNPRPSGGPPGPAARSAQPGERVSQPEASAGTSAVPCPSRESQHSLPPGTTGSGLPALPTPSPVAPGTPPLVVSSPGPPGAHRLSLGAAACGQILADRPVPPPPSWSGSSEGGRLTTRAPDGPGASQPRGGPTREAAQQGWARSRVCE